jgi:Nuclease-related domain
VAVTFAMIDTVMAPRMVKLRRADVCVGCRRALAAGSKAWWDADVRTVTCAACYVTGESAPLPELDRGVAGASVAREHQRRKHGREAQAPVHRVIGRAASVRRAPQHETAFRRGEQGELAVAAYLEHRTRKAPTIVLHDRQMPRGHGNIDHLAVAPAGVFVIDAKRYRGKVGVVDRGFQGERLFVNGRDRTKVVDGLDRQVAAVRKVLSDLGQDEVVVQGVFCFTKRNVPLFGTQTVCGHLLLRPRPLARRLRAQGPLAPNVIDGLARALAAVLRSA